MKLLKLVPDDTNIKFLKWRIPFFAVSILLIAASWGLVMTKGLNYGVDFSGGLEVRATFTQSQDAPVAELRELVGGLGYGDPVVQRFGEDNQVSIRVRLPDEVASFIVTHARRDIPSLVAALDILRRAALTEKRKITLPLARQVLSSLA